MTVSHNAQEKPHQCSSCSSQVQADIKNISKNRFKVKESTKHTKSTATTIY